jgi:hypothetical protein
MAKVRVVCSHGKIEDPRYTLGNSLRVAAGFKNFNPDLTQGDRV